MSGIYSGLQARIKKINELAHFIPCATHLMNLVVKFATDCCNPFLTFYKNYFISFLLQLVIG